MVTLSLLLLLSLAVAAPRAPQVFTVDDDGLADFPGLAQAIASPLVSDGDTLLVGGLPFWSSYGNILLDKALHILPKAGQRYSVDDVTIQGVTSFSLVGADVHGDLTVTSVPGRSVIERCVVEELYWSSQYSGYAGHTLFSGCAELLVQRSYFRGTEACVDHGIGDAEHAMEIESSTVVLSDCLLLGGNEQGSDCRVPWYPTSGSGLVARMGSVVQLVDSTLIAGTAPFFGGAGKLPAVQVFDSAVVIRGNSRNFLRASLPLLTIELDATSTVSVSGVVLDPPALPPSVVTPLPAEPFLRATGGEAPGTALTVDLFGPTGASALLALSVTPALLTLPTVSEQLWLHPTGIFFLQPLSAAGQEVPVGVPFTLPTDPVLVGFPLTFQAWVATAGGAGPWLTNPLELVLGG